VSQPTDLFLQQRHRFSFKAMFQSGMADAQQSQVPFPTTREAAILGALIEYCYTA
jgi:hypothetical protein